MTHESLLDADQAVIVQGHHQFRLAPCFQRGERVYDPVMGMNDVGALFPTNRWRVELCEHQDTHWSLLAVESSLLLSSIAVRSIGVGAHPSLGKSSAKDFWRLSQCDWGTAFCRIQS